MKKWLTVTFALGLWAGLAMAQTTASGADNGTGTVNTQSANPYQNQANTGTMGQTKSDQDARNPDHSAQTGAQGEASSQTEQGGNMNASGQSSNLPQSGAHSGKHHKKHHKHHKSNKGQSATQNPETSGSGTQNPGSGTSVPQ